MIKNKNNKKKFFFVKVEYLQIKLTNSKPKNKLNQKKKKA